MLTGCTANRFFETPLLNIFPCPRYFNGATNETTLMTQINTLAEILDSPELYVTSSFFVASYTNPAATHRVNEIWFIQRQWRVFQRNHSSLHLLIRPRATACTNTLSWVKWSWPLWRCNIYNNCILCVFQFLANIVLHSKEILMWGKGVGLPVHCRSF